jgi:hypothetical protein
MATVLQHVRLIATLAVEGNPVIVQATGPLRGARGGGKWSVAGLVDTVVILVRLSPCPSLARRPFGAGAPDCCFEHVDQIV